MILSEMTLRKEGKNTKEREEIVLVVVAERGGLADQTVRVQFFKSGMDFTHQ